MPNSYLLPISTNQDFVHAWIYDLKRDQDFQLIVNDKSTPSFTRRFPAEKRNIILYVNNGG